VCVDTCPAKSLFQKTQYRSAADKRVMVSMQGELKKKSKEKDKAKEAPAAEAGAEPPPPEVPSAPEEG
jgi:formate hydrogenlyase subunit 6/NADH:ubiquinone oxidoreductase subunit I